MLKRSFQHAAVFLWAVDSLSFKDVHSCHTTGIVLTSLYTFPGFKMSEDLMMFNVKSTNYSD